MPIGVTEALARQGVAFSLFESAKEGKIQLTDTQTRRYTIGNVQINPSHNVVTCKSKRIALTPREVALLEVLASEPGRVYPYQVLAERISGGAFYGDSAALKSTVKRLRKKLVGAGASIFIEAARGIGYRLTSIEIGMADLNYQQQDRLG